jgi:predicted nucleic acid-binding protein
VTAAVSRTPVVVDTGVFGASLRVGSNLAARYDRFVAGRPMFVSFQTVAELRFGALNRNWGDARLRQLDERISMADVVYPGPDLVATYAELRVLCVRIGHALGQHEHDADRWIAATALRIGVPLVTDDGIFRAVPGLVVETAD